MVYGFSSVIVAQKIVAQYGYRINATMTHRHRQDSLYYSPFLECFYYAQYHEMPWMEWLNTIRSSKLALTLKTYPAAGSFQLACACLGIPCVGIRDEYAQKVLFPQLCIDSPFDLENAYSKLSDTIQQDRFNEYIKYADSKLPEFNFVNMRRRLEIYIQKWEVVK